MPRRGVIGRFALLSLVASMLVAAGCGKKGPLYLPDAARAAAVAAPAPPGF